MGLGLVGAPVAGSPIAAGRKPFLPSRRCVRGPRAAACACPQAVAENADTIVLTAPDTQHDLVAGHRIGQS